jgi:hypothetical protein
VRRVRCPCTVVRLIDPIWAKDSPWLGDFPDCAADIDARNAVMTAYCPTCPAVARGVFEERQ